MSQALEKRAWNFSARCGTIGLADGGSIEHGLEVCDLEGEQSHK